MLQAKIEQYRQLCTGASHSGLISLVGSLPDKSLLKQLKGEVEAAAKEAFKRWPTEVMKLAPTLGINPLRELLQGWFEGEVIITNGSQQAIDLIMTTLISPEKKLLIDQFAYIGIEEPLRWCGGQLMYWPTRYAHLSAEEIEQHIKVVKPTACYVQTHYANPTGETISKDKLIMLRSLAEEHHFYLIEDQVYGWYEAIESYPMAENVNMWVIQIGSVSKLLTSGLRVGWIVTKNNEILNGLAHFKEGRDLATSTLDQMMTLILMEQPEKLNKWRRRAIQHYEKKRQLLRRAWDKSKLTELKWQDPGGGLYVWIDGGKSFETDDFITTAIDKGVLVAPGKLFDFSNQDKTHFRIALGSVAFDDIETAVKRLASAVLLR